MSRFSIAESHIAPKFAVLPSGSPLLRSECRITLGFEPRDLTNHQLETLKLSQQLYLQPEW